MWSPRLKTPVKYVWPEKYKSSCRGSKLLTTSFLTGPSLARCFQGSAWSDKGLRRGWLSPVGTVHLTSRIFTSLSSHQENIWSVGLRAVIGRQSVSLSPFFDCDQVGSVRQEKYKAIRRKINSKFPTIFNCSKWIITLCGNFSTQFT